MFSSCYYCRIPYCMVLPNWTPLSAGCSRFITWILWGCHPPYGCVLCLWRNKSDENVSRGASNAITLVNSFGVPSPDHLISLWKNKPKNPRCIVWSTKLQEYDGVSNCIAKKNCQDTSKLVQANKVRQLYMYTAVSRKVDGKKDNSALDNLER